MPVTLTAADYDICHNTHEAEMTLMLILKHAQGCVFTTSMHLAIKSILSVCKTHACITGPTLDTQAQSAATFAATPGRPLKLMHCQGQSQGPGVYIHTIHEHTDMRNRYRHMHLQVI